MKDNRISEVGARVRTRRHDRGMSLAEAAKAAGVTVADLTALERGIVATLGAEADGRLLALLDGPLVRKAPVLNALGVG